MNPSIDKKTQILVVDPGEIGLVESTTGGKNGALDKSWIQSWSLELSHTESARNLALAAKKLREEDVPVAFPTETVYGLGADATRSAAVKSIFAAKGRPADNPLIVHFASIEQLRNFIRRNGKSTEEDPIPQVYQPLIRHFWPGPLTILLPLPNPSPLASEVTAGLKTFGARIPASPVALALIRLANVPIAAPSANASTRPSTTAAQHVAQDLDGRIEIILDGGPCDVGVESTVVDGLVSPPVILRPGGVGIEQLRAFPGWEDVRVAYEDKAHKGNDIPRAPGMKYRHYSPRARVILYEAGAGEPTFDDIARQSHWEKVGFVRTKHWRECALFSDSGLLGNEQANGARKEAFSLLAAVRRPSPKAKAITVHDTATGAQIGAVAVDLGGEAADVARGLFSALREVDSHGVAVMFVEGIADGTGDGNVAAAVMNRLRKAAEIISLK
jgi:L-threonylcarbamoyladenylate synthase